ncbi:MAG: hypothetical protein DYG96_08715 [Chlorobi bacterium CHB2]|nr:hypothetical protein [Chlorobi bacterium CHB2]
MKRLLLLAAGIVMGTMTTQAQEMGGIQAQELPIIQNQGKLPTIADPAKVSEVVGYGWYSIVYVGAPNDTGATRSDINRNDPPIPLKFANSGSVMRGMGQIFAPNYLYNFLNGSVYNETSNWYFDGTGSQGLTDQDYIDQFKGATAWSLDSLFTFFYQNSEKRNSDGFAKVELYKINADFNGSSYKQNGYAAIRSSLSKVYEEEIDADKLAATVDGNRIYGTRFEFPQPLEFNAGESVMYMFLNESSGPDEFSKPNGDYQRIYAVDEYQSGDYVIVDGQTKDTRKDQLTPYKSMATVLIDGVDEADTIMSAWRYLILGGKAVSMNLYVRFYGAVDLQEVTGVKYHFGKDATSQGLGETTPNPVVSNNARLPYSLTETAYVTIDLYTANGDHVANLVDHKLVPGNYSVALPLDNMNNGAYVVRMLANGKAYSSKLSVVR